MNMNIFHIEIQRRTRVWFPDFFTALLNKKYVLDCLHDNSDKILKWIWFLDGVATPYNALKWVYDKYTSLTISNVQNYNAGTYTCATFKGDQEVYSCSMYLAVISKLDV